MTAPPFLPDAVPLTGLGKTLGLLMEDTRAALADNLAATVSGAIGHTFLVPGVQVAADWCCPGNCGDSPCGQAWVRLVQLYPSRTFPVLDLTYSKAPGSQLAVQFELGVLRCVHGLDDDGNAPLPAEMTGDALAALDDVAAMRATALGALGPRRVVLGQYTAVGPQGYCSGGTTLFTAALSC